jgi:hypothetical protein
LYHPAGNVIGFSTSGIERARIDGNGFLGIGTTTPGSLLSLGSIANFTAATSTFYSTGGINLTAGCFAVNGTCVGGSSFTNTLANGGTATTTFYNGGVVFSDGSKLTQSATAANFFWDETNKRLGFGTSSPWAALSINPDVANGTAPAFAVGSSTGTNLIVTNAGKVGIGTSSPFTTLGVAGNAFIASTASNAFSVGTQGVANPAFVVDNSTASAVNGWKVTSTASGGGARLTVVSSNSSESGVITSLGNLFLAAGNNSSVLLQPDGTTRVTINPASQVFAPASRGAAAGTPFFTFTGNSGVNMNASTEGTQVLFNLSTFQEHAAGAIAQDRAFRIQAPNHIFQAGVSVANSTIASSTTFSIDGPPTQGIFANFTNAIGAYIGAGNVYTSASTTNAYGLFVEQPVGAANNVAAMFNGRTSIGSTTPWAQLSVNPTTTNGTSPAFAVGSSSATNFVVTNAGRVGIGTAAPSTNLQVSGSGSQAVRILTSTNDNATVGLELGGNNSVAWDLYTNNSGLLGAIDTLAFYAPSGNVGTKFVLRNDGRVFVPIDSSSGQGKFSVGSSTPWGLLSANPLAAVGTAPSFVIGSSTGTTFIVDNAGKVGIGTSTPGSLLSIQGIANFTTATSTFSSTGGINLTAGCFAVNGTCVGGSSFTNTLANGGTATTTFYSGGLVFSDGSKLTQAANTGVNTLFWDNTNGRLGIGTTSPNWQLSISGTTGARIKTTTNTTNALVVENSVGSSTLQVDTLDNATSVFSVATSTGTTYFYIDASGNTGIGTTTPTATLSVGSAGSERFANFGAGTLQTDALGNLSVSSDERLKDVNGSFDRGLAEIEQLSPILYHWNATSKLDQSTQYAGFSAQNVQSVIPEAVDTDPRGYLTLSDRPILAASVNAIKELAGRTSALSISTTTLGSRVDSLEAALGAVRAPSAPALPQNISVESIATKSLSVNGNALATAFIAPATPITFTIASTTGSLPDEVLAEGGVDLYKAATYAITGVQSLQAQTNVLANRLDTVELRVTMLEAIASSTPATGALSLASLEDLFGQFGLMIKNGIAHFTSLAFTNLIAAPGADGTSAVATSTIPAGALAVTVANPLTHPSSKIFVTITAPLTGSWYISQKNEGTFTINLSSMQTQDVTFDYFIVQTEGNTQVASAAAAPAGTVSTGVTSSPTDASTTPAATNPPTIVLIGEAATSIAQGGFWTDPGATATDSEGHDLTSQIAVSGSVDANTPGLYTINYSVVDGNGVSAGVSRVVTVSAPSISAPSESAPPDPAAPADAPVPASSDTAVSDAGSAPSGG